MAEVITIFASIIIGGSIISIILAGIVTDMIEEANKIEEEENKNED